MKVLSIEEKAKRYDEAIERARKINSGDGVEAPPDWTTCEVIFPELKESEDERIRKWIIDDIRYNMNNEQLNNSEYKKKAKKAIAWLEKQGEQKPAWSEEDIELLDNTIKFIEDSVAATSPYLRTYSPTLTGKEIPFLKALKERYTWKPSDGQMKQLGWVAEQNKNNMIGKELMTLYQDLKKAKGE